MGKLPEYDALTEVLLERLEAKRFAGLAITVEHGEAAGRLPEHHRDPFDRMLIAQAFAERLTLVSNERLFDQYGVERLW